MSNEMQNGRQMRFTEDELALIRATFKGNEPLLKLMRKVFLPELDPEAPIGQMIDLYYSLPMDQSLEDIGMKTVARNTVIGHIDMQLMQLKFLSEQDDLTPEEALQKLKKNSTK
jgi:hypothetical protein